MEVYIAEQSQISQNLKYSNLTLTMQTAREELKMYKKEVGSIKANKHLTLLDLKRLTFQISDDKVG